MERIWFRENHYRKSYDYLTAVRSSIIIDIEVQLTNKINDKMLAAKYIKKQRKYVI